MKSMTGYSHMGLHDRGYNVSIEIKSFNNKYLDIKYQASSNLSLESLIDEKIRALFQRGSFIVAIKIIKDDNFNTSVFGAFVEDLKNQQKEYGLKDLTLFEAYTIYYQRSFFSEIKDEILWAIDKALSEVLENREKEGQKLKEILINYTKGLKVIVDEIAALVKEREESLIEETKEKIQFILKDADENRVSQEIALLLTKRSIEEEIQRLYIHINYLESILNEEGPIGKRIDFISQELNREATTIASKSLLNEVSVLSVKLREIIDNIREQGRNVE